MQKNRYIMRRKILLLSFTLMLIFSLATITFSWYRNYVEVVGPEITTGHINVNMSSYYVNNFEIKSEKNKTIDSSTIGNVTLDSNIETFIPDGNTHMYYFFENPEAVNSIDLEILVSMNTEGLYSDYDTSRMGVVNITLDNETADFKDWVTQKYTSNPTLSSDRFEQFIKDSSVEHSGGDTRNFLEIDKALISGAVNQGDVLCIRVTVTLNESATVSHLDKSYPLRMSLCIAQEGGLPGQEKITTYYASTLSALNSALNLYKPNDKIIITSDIEYIGDLIFNRPVNLVIQNATLTVYGNLMFSYSYPGSFFLNTAQAGRVCVYRIYNAGGDLEVDLPKSSLELIGKNSTVAGQGDIYVQRYVNLTASEDVGVVFTSSRICETTDVGVYLDTLKDISVGNKTRLEVGTRTEIGNIHSDVKSVIRIRNNGSINTIKLDLMIPDNTYISSPNIFIDNYSNINSIILPDWSSKFIERIVEGSEEKEYRGNTRIVSNVGASKMTISCTGEFKSDGSKDPATDDVEYARMAQFVEAVNGNKSDVIVHYTTTEIEGLANDNTLQGILEYYASTAGGNIINSANEIVKLKVICYSGSSMTYTANDNTTNYYNDDYEYIREKMTALTYLDLSDAVSAGYTTPNNAFENMTSLTNVYMSEVDTTWGTNNFKNTGVVEITIPTSVTTLPRFSLIGLKYIHTNYVVFTTNSTFITEIKNANQYLFTPDENTHDAFVAAGFKNDKTFVEATRYSGLCGDYFLRIDDNASTFELATIVADSFDLSQLKSDTFGLDFDTIMFEGIQYKLTAIDDYAFYGKKFTNSDGFVDFIFGDQLTLIGDYAFRDSTGINSIVFKGPTRIESYAFYNMALMTNVDAELVPYLGTYAFGSAKSLVYFNAPSLVDFGNYFVSGAEALKVAEFGMIADSTKVYATGSTCNTVIIHTDNAPDPSVYTTKINLGLNFSVIVVNEDYRDVWENSYYYNANSYRTEDIIGIPGNLNTDLIFVGEEIYPEFIYFKNKVDELTLVRCVLKEINGLGNDYTVPTVSKVDNSLIFTNNNTDAYKLVEISGAAYKYTQIYNVKTLTFLDTIKKIGDCAFKGAVTSRTGLSKEYGYLELNNVEEIGSYAFAGNLMSKVTANSLITSGNDAFADCTSTVIAIIPELRNTTGAIFKNHTALKAVLIGPLDGTASGVIHSRLNIDLILVNNTESVGTIDRLMYNVGTTLYWLTSSNQPVIFVGNQTATSTDLVVESFNSLYFADFYDESVTINDITYTYEIPSYAFYSIGTELVLASKLSPIEDDDFEVASEIFLTEDDMSFLGIEGKKFVTTKPVGYVNDVKYVATKIGNYALKHTKIGVNVNLKLGDNYTEIGQYGLYGIQAYSADLNNVTILGRYGLDNAKIFQLKSDKVEKVDYHSLSNLSNIDVINLPNATYIEEYGFRYSAMSKVIIGERLVTFRRHVFEQNKNLEVIYILSTKYDKSTSVDYIYESSIPNINSILLYVPSSMVTYFRNDNNTVNILDSNILGFEQSYNEESTGLLYLWSKLDNNKAQLESIVGLTSASGITQLELPDIVIETIITEVTGGETTTQVIEEIPYTVTAIGPSFFTNLKGENYITDLILPDNLELFEIGNTELSITSISNISISENNTKFQTQDGILYTKGLKVLLLYPAAKQGDTFNLPEATEIIYSYAFANNIYLSNINFASDVIILDGAFKGCTSLNTVEFTSNEPSKLIGKDLFVSNATNLVIYVPTGTKASYVANITFDLTLADIIQER